LKSKNTEQSDTEKGLDLSIIARMEETVNIPAKDCGKKRKHCNGGSVESQAAKRCRQTNLYEHGVSGNTSKDCSRNKQVQDQGKKSTIPTDRSTDTPLADDEINEDLKRAEFDSEEAYLDWKSHQLALKMSREFQLEQKHKLSVMRFKGMKDEYCLRKKKENKAANHSERATRSRKK